MILKTLVLGPFETNCYLVGDEKSKAGMIIDPADNARAILKEIKDAQLNIKIIVLTHGHMDHIGALKEVKEATKAIVAMHKAEADSLQGHRSLGTMFGLDYPAPDAPDRLLADGDMVDVDSLHFKVLHTPGHTPGGICLVGEGIAFTGDTLFNSSIGRTDFPGGSYNKIIESIKTRLLALPDETVAYPGHGPTTTISNERTGNPFLGQ